jgi:CheY-like chemotaxis protein
MKTLRVLIVEDDALIAMLFAELLAGMGHTVCATAATEGAAVHAAAHYRPDLISTRLADAPVRTGLGTSIVEALTRQLGGRIATLAASPGTTVSVTVPRAVC